jgi:hypothetical protein
MEIVRLRSLIRKLIVEETKKFAPDDAPPSKQLHIFDFDDTLGLTRDSNGIMLYVNGEPAWKTAKQAADWVKSVGIGDADLLSGPKGNAFEQPDGIDGFAAYISSGALAKARSQVDVNLVAPTKPGPEVPEALVADYTPSTSVKTAEAIPTTIDRAAQASSKGAKTGVVTARSGESSSAKRGTPRDFSGKEHPPSTESDIDEFMKQQGVDLSVGVTGMGGGNKGKYIKQKFYDAVPDAEKPEEIHFYDDDPKNISDVEAALAGTDVELHLYGPGHFDKGHADPSKPSKSIPPGDEGDKRQVAGYIPTGNVMVERWQRLAGIIK